MGSRHFILLACLMAAPAAAQSPADPGEEVLPIGWSLSESAGAREAAKSEPASAQRPKARQQKRAKPRLIGRARISNSRLKSRKGAASVGVAVPF